VPLDLDDEEAERPLLQLERDQRGSFDRLPLRVRMQSREYPYWRPTVVAEGRLVGRQREEAFGGPATVRQAPVAAAGYSADTSDSQAASNVPMVPSGLQTVLERCEPVVRFDTRSGLSRTSSSSPPVLSLKGDHNLSQDFSGSIRPPPETGAFPIAPLRLILEILLPYVSSFSTLPPMATAIVTKTFNTNYSVHCFLHFVRTRRVLKNMKL